jgi:predicted esterase
MKKLFLCLSAVFTLAVSAQQVPKSLTASNGQFIGFLQYTPTDYDANTNTKYPLIIFLHGIGERGNGTTQLSNVGGLGVPGAITNGHNMRFTWNGKTETFLVLSPQLDSKFGWWQHFYVDEMINYAKRNLRVDTNRIILTGLSLGGGGVWSYAGSSLANAKKLAAIGVCCGTCQNLNWSNITNANLPVWAFHASDDGTVGAGCTTGAIKAINNLNPAVVPYMTIWPTGQHWIWGRVFDTQYNWQNPNIYEWWLGQNKSLPVNKRPVAKAGNPLSILSTLGIVTLNGSGSTDADGRIVRYIWSKISGPTSGVITASVSLNGSTTVTGLTLPGTYQYELKVVDDRADWSLDTVTVTVGLGSTGPSTNKVPVVNAGSDVTITLPTASVTLSGTGSDPDGYVAGYAWTKVSGPASSSIASQYASSTAISQLTEGTYVFRLTATDNNNATASDDVTVTVKASGTSTGGGTTGVNAGTDATITLPTSSVSLDGSASTGTITAWKWTKISGPSQYTITNPTASVTTVTNLAAGTYTFQLTIWNSDWVPTTDTKVVTVNASTTNPPPATIGQIANAGADITITQPVSSATLNGSASADPKGVIKSWKWTLLSGPSAATIANPSASVTAVSNLLSQGTYKFRLTVWDYDWVPRSDTMQIIVNGGTSAGTTPPAGSLANAGADITVLLPSNSATLNGSASVDPLGVIKAWQWIKISGPEQHNIANASVSVTTVSNLVEGTYQFKLIVWGNDWRPKADTVQVTVVSATSTTAARTTTITSESKTVVVEDALNAEQLLVYPNPAQDQINVQTTSAVTGASFVNIYDMAGKLVRKSAFQKGQALHQQSLNVTALVPGVYHLEVVIDNKTRLNSKFIKQ